MKLKFSTILNTIEGEPIIEVVQGHDGNPVAVLDEKRKPKRLTAWDLARMCLTSDVRTDAQPHGQRPEPVDGGEKFKRMDLALRILEANRRGEECDVSTEEQVLLKSLAGKLYTSNAVYAFYRFIEGKEQCQPISKTTDGEKVVHIGGAQPKDPPDEATPAVSAA